MPTFLDVNQSELPIKSNRSILFGLFFLAFAIRLIAIAFSDNEDGDAIARLLYSRAVIESLDLVPSTVWLPGHFYLLAIPFALGLKSALFAIVLTALVSALAAPLSYSLVLQFFDRSSAILSGVLIAVYALHIRFSIITVSEGPFLTLVLASLLFSIAYVRSGRSIFLIVGAIAFNAACSMRFEGWIMPPLLFAAYIATEWLLERNVVSQKILRAATFTGASMIFCLFWLVFCQVNFEDPFYFQHQTLEENLRYFAALSSKPYGGPPGTTYLLAFFPGVAVLSMGPLSALVSVCGLAFCIAKRLATPLTGFAATFIIFILSQILLKNLVPQARYFLTVCSILLLFAGPGLTYLSRLLEPRFEGRFLKYFFVGFAVIWPCVIFFFSTTNAGVISQKMYSVSPNPHFDKEVIDVNEWLRNNGTATESLAFFPGETNFTGPWSSLLDGWYGIQSLKSRKTNTLRSRQAHFLNSIADFSILSRDERCGHLVIPKRILGSEFDFGSAPLNQLHAVYENREYQIFSWGGNCVGEPSEIH